MFNKLIRPFSSWLKLFVKFETFLVFQKPIEKVLHNSNKNYLSKFVQFNSNTRRLMQYTSIFTWNEKLFSTNPRLLLKDRLFSNWHKLYQFFLVFYRDFSWKYSGKIFKIQGKNPMKWETYSKKMESKKLLWKKDNLGKNCRRTEKRCYSKKSGFFE